MRSLLAVLTALSVLAVPCAHADDIDGFTPDRLVPTREEQGAHDAAFDDEGYVERWMLMVNRDDGGWMQLSFAITHAGPGSRHGVVDLMRLAAPLSGPPDAAPGFYRWPIKQKVVVAEREGLSLRFDDNLLVETPTGYRARLSEWGYELELEVRRDAPAFRPGSAPLRFPNGGIVAIELPAVATRVTGRERTHGGAWRPIRGVGWMDHGLTTRLPHLLASRVLRFQGRSGPWAVATFELHAPKALSGQRFGFMVVTHKGAVVASSVEALSTVAAFRKDPGKPGRKVPRRWSVRLDTPDGPLTLRVTAGKSLFREDVLEPMNPFIRAFLEPFLRPINDHDRARFELALPKALGQRLGAGEGPVTGRGVSVFTTVPP